MSCACAGLSGLGGLAFVGVHVRGWLSGTKVDRVCHHDEKSEFSWSCLSVFSSMHVNLWRGSKEQQRVITKRGIVRVPGVSTLISLCSSVFLFSEPGLSRKAEFLRRLFQ